MLIDKTYFQADIQIPNLTEEDFGTDLISILIESKSFSFLQSVLGLQNFNELKSYTTDGILNDDAPDKWKNLVYGCSYEKHEQYYHFKGLIQSGNLFRTSLIADYVYCNWLIQTRSQQTQVGEVVVNAQNATNVNSNSKLVTIWNKFMVQFKGDARNRPHFYYHCGVPVIDFYSGNKGHNVSLYKFLEDNEHIYEHCPKQLPQEDELQTVINSLGIC